MLLGLGARTIADEDYLARFEWTHRPLLVFAPEAIDPRVEILRNRFAIRHCAMRERDMVVGLMVEDGASRMDGAQLSPATVRAMRERFDVSDGMFVVVLVGKDGGEKLRETDLPDLDQIFDLIDGMPMRREEMLTRDRACEQ